MGGWADGRAERPGGWKTPQVRDFGEILERCPQNQGKKHLVITIARNWQIDAQSQKRRRSKQSSAEQIVAVEVVASQKQTQLPAITFGYLQALEKAMEVFSQSESEPSRWPLELLLVSTNCHPHQPPSLASPPAGATGPIGGSHAWPMTS